MKKKIFLPLFCVLIAILVSVGIGVGMASAVTIENHTMCKDTEDSIVTVRSSTGHSISPVNETTEFYVTDSRAVCLVQIERINRGDTFRFEWYDPSDLLYQVDNSTTKPYFGCWFAIYSDRKTSYLDAQRHIILQAGTVDVLPPQLGWERCWLSSTLKISGYPPANMTGNWHVDFYYNDEKQLIETFTISAPTPRSKQLALEHLKDVMDKYHSDFDVYTDLSDAGNHFVMLAWMGSDVEINPGCFENPYRGATCIENKFNGTGTSWGGWYLMNGVLEGEEIQPKANWGEHPNAGFNLTGAAKLTFWARGKEGGESVEFFAFSVGRNADTSEPITPYPDSSPKRSLGYITLSKEWQHYTIDLSGVDLSYVLGGFGWVTNAPQNDNQPIIFYLDDIKYDENRLDEPRFLVSYELLPTDEPVLKNIAYTYDNDLALLAFLANGTKDDLRRARLIGDALVYAINNDRYFTDGRLRNAYQGGDLKLFPGWTPHGRSDTVRMPGWWDMTNNTWYEDKYCASTHTGNVAWSIIALLSLYDETHEAKYLNASIRLGEWIEAECRNETGAGGYTGGYEGWERTANNPQGQKKILWKSTEHNIDVYVAFSRLYNLTENEMWKEGASHAKRFVTAMWDEAVGHLWTGTLEDGITINKAAIPADVNAWGLMALEETDKYKKGIEWVGNNCYVEADGFKGFDFNNDNDGVWFEGTAHMIVAYQILGEETKANLYLGELERAQKEAQNANGKGLVAASHDEVTTGFDWVYNARLHIGATAWFIFGELGYNPYWNIKTSEPIPSFVSEASAKTWHVDDDFADYPAANFSSIQEAIDAANASDTVFVHNGTYYENVIINKPLKLIGESKESIIHGAWYGNCVKIMSSNVSIDGFKIKYSGSDGAGIYVSSNNNTLANNTIIENGYGIKLIGDNNAIKDNIITNNGEDIYLESSFNKIINNTMGGINIKDSDYNIIASNYVAGSIDLEDSSHNNIINNSIKADINLEKRSSYNNIVNNSIKIGITLDARLEKSVKSNYNIIVNNTIKYINLKGGNHNKIINNVINQSNGDGVNINYGWYCRWVGAIIQYWECDKVYSKHNEIAGNIINSSNGRGIYLGEKSNNTKVINNVITLGGNNAIYVSGSSEIEVINNSINSNKGCGIYLYASDYSDITNNSINSNQGEGIYLYKSSNNNLTSNEISSNKNGTYLTEQSGKNQITNNSIKNNEFGIYLSSGSSLNKIYHNNFINNTIQAEEYRSVNHFDNGPIIGGNYWSDHECKGNPSNGTQPYIIPVHNNQDKYPFENEKGWL